MNTLNNNLKLIVDEQKALREFKVALRKKFGSRLVLLKLFGSKARGDFHKESDLDVLVVIRNLKSENNRWIWGLVFDILAEKNVYISPLNFSFSKWEEYQQKRFSLARNVEEEGVKI